MAVTSADALAHGFALDQWEAAVGLQVALRDALKRPMSLLDALQALTAALQQGQCAGYPTLAGHLHQCLDFYDSERQEAKRQARARELDAIRS